MDGENNMTQFTVSNAGGCGCGTAMLASIGQGMICTNNTTLMNILTNGSVHTGHLCFAMNKTTIALLSMHPEVMRWFNLLPIFIGGFMMSSNLVHFGKLTINEVKHTIWKK
jgi:hypothetical protein